MRGGPGEAMNLAESSLRGERSRISDGWLSEARPRALAAGRRVVEAARLEDRAREIEWAVVLKDWPVAGRRVRALIAEVDGTGPARLPLREAALRVGIAVVHRSAAEARKAIEELRAAAERARSDRE
jgi:hypothetical protein